MYVEEYHTVFLGFSGWNIKKKKSLEGMGKKDSVPELSLHVTPSMCVIQYL